MSSYNNFDGVDIAENGDVMSRIQGEFEGGYYEDEITLPKDFDNSPHPTFKDFMGKVKEVAKDVACKIGLAIPHRNVELNFEDYEEETEVKEMDTTKAAETKAENHTEKHAAKTDVPNISHTVKSEVQSGLLKNVKIALFYAKDWENEDLSQTLCRYISEETKKNTVFRICPRGAKEDDIKYLEFILSNIINNKAYPKYKIVNVYENDNPENRDVYFAPDYFSVSKYTGNAYSSDVRSGDVQPQIVVRTVATQHMFEGDAKTYHSNINEFISRGEVIEFEIIPSEVGTYAKTFERIESHIIMDNESHTPYDSYAVFTENNRELYPERQYNTYLAPKSYEFVNAKKDFELSRKNTSYHFGTFGK